jgi:AraC-like DNA-binding protein
LLRPEEKPGPANHTDPFLLKLYDFIERHIDNAQLSAEMLAKETNMSHRTLNRKLEMIAGLSAYKMIRQYRLKKAAVLLQSGCTVSEAAYRTGFESPSYFSVSFKACYGLSPSEYVSNSLQ